MAESLSEIIGVDVPRETFERLTRYVSLLLDENNRQNLIARSTEGEVWQRHILDSAQIIAFAPRPDSSWLDIGSGAGLPGLVIAILTDAPMTLVEPRRLRADFLKRVIDELALSERVAVHAAKAERISGSFDVITARAVSSLTTLLRISRHLSTDKTRWLFPKGKRAQSELDDAQRTWQGKFRLEPSRTDTDAAIIIADQVQPRGKR